MTEALLPYRYLFTQRLSTLVHSRDPEVLAAVRSGEAAPTGFVGDAWTRLFDDVFA